MVDLTKKELQNKFNNKLPLGIIFDFDGTIIDSEDIHFEMYKEMSLEVNYSLTLGTYNDVLIGKTDEQIFEFIISETNSKVDINKLIQKKQNTFIEQLKTGMVSPIIGVVDFIKSLSDNNYKIGLATSAPIEEVKLGLSSFGIIDLFDVIVTVDQVEKGKPAPDVYLKAATDMGLTPDNCLVYEDSIAGVTGAVDAKMNVVAISSINHEKFQKLGVKHIMPNFSEHRMEDMFKN